MSRFTLLSKYIFFAHQKTNYRMELPYPVEKSKSERASEQGNKVDSSWHVLPFGPVVLLAATTMNMINGTAINWCLC